MKRSQGFRKPHRIKRKKSILKNRFFRFAILFLIFGSAVFYLLIFSATFQVDKIVVTKEKKVLTQEIKDLIGKEIESKVVFFSTKSIFLVDDEKIRESILNSFPAIAEVEIHRGFPDVLNIIVIERLVVAYWCQDWSQVGQCFLLDTEGVIFSPVLLAKPAELLRIKTSVLNKKVKLRDRVIEKAKIAELLEIASKLKENLKIPVDSAEIVSEEWLNFRTNEKWEIYFNPKEDIDWQLTELNLLLENKIPLEKREILEYIDLRFSRVYYKYR